MPVSRPKFGIGASALRKEDKSFVTGHGQYTDDIKVEGCLHGFVLRAQTARSTFKIRSISDALESPGVKLVLTGTDVAHLKPLATSDRPDKADGSSFVSRDIPILCLNQTQYSGDAIAFIVAETLAQAEDAAEKIDVEFDPQEVVIKTAAALDPDAPLVWRY